MKFRLVCSPVLRFFGPYQTKVLVIPPRYVRLPGNSNLRYSLHAIGQLIRAELP